MPTDRRSRSGLSVEEGVQAVLLLMPRVIGRIKRIPVPPQLRTFSLTPRHLSLLAYLLSDGPLTIKELARRLEVAPTTVSLMVGDLSRQGIVDRREDDADRRRTIVSIADTHRQAIEDWLAAGAKAWRKALEPLTASERQKLVDALTTYERELAGHEHTDEVPVESNDRSEGPSTATG
jgi:DNA-binding MarR family transcriptional regulator